MATRDPRMGHESMAQKAEHEADRTQEKVRETTREVTDTAQAKAESTLDKQKERAAHELGAVARALHSTGGQLRDEDEGQVARYADMAADRLEEWATRLNTMQADEIVREVEGFARRRPEIFLGGALALGVIASRFLKSSQRPPEREGRVEAWQHEMEGPATGAAEIYGTHGTGAKGTYGV